MRKADAPRIGFRPFLGFAAALALPATGAFIAVAAEEPATAAETELVEVPASEPDYAAAAPITVTPDIVEDVAVPTPAIEAPQFEEIGTGEASYYGRKFAGNRTANGERFDPGRLTAAHRTLPFGSKVKVTNPRNGRSVVVRINDRGPFHGNRVIDLSKEAARQIGLIQRGSGKVRLALQQD